MKAIQAHPQQGLDGPTLVDLPDPGEPGPAAIRVPVHATSLDFHDLGVVTGRLPGANGSIPIPDGAGVVEAVGSKVTEFKPVDHVVSTFFPTWLDGEATLADFTATPGDGIDGYAQEVVVAPATSFTRAPVSWSHAAAATMTTAGVTAWWALMVNGGLKAGDSILVLCTGTLAQSIKAARMGGHISPFGVLTGAQARCLQPYSWRGSNASRA